jgi:hypothetical protein
MLEIIKTFEDYIINLYDYIDLEYTDYFLNIMINNMKKSKMI